MKIVFFANTDWYLYNFRLAIALYLKSQGADVVMLSPAGSFGPRFAEHDIRWITLAMDRASLNPAREAITMQQLTRLLRTEAPDILHNFTVKCAVYGSFAARVAKVPAVVNAVAGMGYVFSSDRPKARVLRPIVKLLMRNTLGARQSRLILQNNDDVDAFIISQMVPRESIRLIRSSGVNTTRFCPETNNASGRKRLKVLLAARLLREKGIREFSEAAATVKRRGHDIEFLLAGMPDPGNPHSIDRNEVEQWHEQETLRWLGHVDDMPALMRSVDVMVLPSYYREGVPRSLIEAAASGLALVTTDLPGCREVVAQHGIDGLHVKPRDAGSLADALITLDNDRELLRRLGQCARQRALTDFDERLVIDKTVQVYSELLHLAGATVAK
jgi:glycosyltransferase involved in cell wall biosynthesis